MLKVLKTGKLNLNIAVGRQGHNQWLDQYLAQQEESPPQSAGSPKVRMSQKLKTQKGREIYRLRKMTVEPVFGIIKEVMGFRKFFSQGRTSGQWRMAAGLLCIQPQKAFQAEFGLKKGAKFAAQVTHKAPGLVKS